MTLDTHEVALPSDVNTTTLAGRWVEIIYDSSLFDRLVRPMICWRGIDGMDQVSFGSAPLFGRGQWIGLVPLSARYGSIKLISGDPPRFRIVSVKALHLSTVFARAFVRRPGLALLAARSMLTGERKRTERRLLTALAGAALADAGNWTRSRLRAFEPEGLERPRAEGLPHLRLVTNQGDVAWTRKISGSRASWSLRQAKPFTRIAALTADLAEFDLVVVLHAGDQLTPDAVAIVREVAAKSAACVFYSDEMSLIGDQLRLKPDWSPVLAQNIDLIGRALFMRAGWLRTHFPDLSIGDIDVLRPDGNAKVEHIRRVLLASDAAQSTRLPAHFAPLPKIAKKSVGPATSIIIPTRDRPDLLAACLKSLECLSFLETIVVDNGSTSVATLTLLQEVASRPEHRVLYAPGPFNFSHLCNLGAAAAAAPLLVFLNDDVEAENGQWLDPMAHWAMQPDIGAVGAKLLYPDQRVQHAGIVLGIGGRAGHTERLCTADDPGYFGRLNVPHEVAAVTGACLAVEARKFAAVGGFDAENLPVDLNDVDLCLRLAERGWRSLMEPRSRLMHRESATRGTRERSEVRYRKEIVWFEKRWQREIADDPYYHPALSLNYTSPTLG